MKIFNNFDTTFCETIFAKKVKEYWDDNVFVVKRSKFFWFFHGLFPLIFIILLVLFWMFILFKYNLSEIYVYGFLIFSFIVLWKVVLNKYLRYKFDFTIIDPKWIFTYKQDWFLNSSFKEISSNNIKSIQVVNNSIFGNIFWYGSIEIISDLIKEVNHDEDMSGIISLDFVNSNYTVKEKISKICF